MPESTNISQPPTDPEQENEKSNTHAAGSDLVPFDGLTLKQYLFINAYLGEAKGNATEAAALAGYSGSRDVLRQMAYENLTKPDIITRVRAAARLVMGEHETLERLATYIRNPPANPIERNAWVKAIELMMKYHGVLTDKVEHSGTVEQQVKQMIVHVHGEVGGKQ